MCFIGVDVSMRHPPEATRVETKAATPAGERMLFLFLDARSRQQVSAEIRGS